MSNTVSLKNIKNEYGELCYPILIRNNQVAVFRITEEESQHSFGGGLPDTLDIQKGAIVHRVASITIAACPLISDLSINHMDLLYAFRHDGDGAEYVYQDSRIKVGKITPAEPDADWPYDNFPDEFPRKALDLWGILELSDDQILDLLHQDIYINEDRIVAVVPPSEDYGVSLWGEYGDPEMVQCVFEYSISKSSVNTYNLCG